MWKGLVSRVAQGVSHLALSKEEQFVVMASSRLDYIGDKLHEVIFASPEARFVKSLDCELEYCAFLNWMFKAHAGSEILARRFSFDDVAALFVRKHLEHTRATTGIRAVEQVLAEHMPGILQRVEEYQTFFVSGANQRNGFEATFAHFAELYCRGMSNVSDRARFWTEWSDVFKTTFEKIFPPELGAIRR